MIKYSELRQKLQIESMNGNAEDIAYLTHFLQNQNIESSNYFIDRAKTYYERLEENLVSDSLSFQNILPIKWDVPFPGPENPEFTFIDLFAGIGGFRIPLQKLGGKCLFSSEYNYHAQRSYELNFGEVPFGDISKVDINIIPQHDVLCAGFPCQPFSISGKMKGFEDTRGTLIYHVFEIIEKTKPKVVFLENVKHLLYHDNRKTLKTIIKDLEGLDYKVSYKVLNASDFGVPQNRERIIIIGHKHSVFDFNKIEHQTPKLLKDILDEENDFEYLDEPYTILENQRIQQSGLLFAGYRNKTIRKAGVREGTEHLSRVHKQPNRIYSSEGVHPALPSQESSGRFWIYHKGTVRKLTINECYKIMGFPENFKLIYNKAELYKQIGNSVCIPMINSIGQQLKEQFL